MADDIVTRLRCNPCDCDGTCYTCQAADEIERLRAERDAIDALHQPWTEGDNWCKTCDVAWPCMTARLLHPEEVRRG